MVAPVQTERPYTADDLASLPDDGKRYEVIGGELIMSPSPSRRHQLASSYLLRSIQTHLDTTDKGVVLAAPFDVHLGRNDVVQPDIVVVLTENSERLKEFGIVGPPDLIIEILSPSTARVDRIRKTATYATFGVPEYWLVDPEHHSILAQRLVEGLYLPIESRDGSIRSEVVAGLTIDPADVFAVPEWLTGR